MSDSDRRRTPTLGYPSLTEACRALAAALRISTKAVARLLEDRSSPRKAAGLPPAVTGAALLLAPDVRARLAMAAACRDTSLDVLLARLLTVIAREDLVEAVLDDGGAAAVVAVWAWFDGLPWLPRRGERVVRLEEDGEL